MHRFKKNEQPVKASYIKLESIETIEPGNRVAIGEIGIIITIII